MISKVIMEIEQTNKEETANKEDLIIRELEENHYATEASKNVLLGKIISEKLLNKKAIKGMIKKSWGDPEGFSIIDLSANTFLFNFTKPEIPSKILDESPWNILGHVLVLERWSPQVSMREIEFLHAPYWIQIHGMPLELFSKHNAIRVGNKIGEALEAKDPFHATTIIRGFLRVRVSVNITNPLVPEFLLQRNTLPKIWIQIRYEKLLDHCFNCVRLSHDQRSCKQKKIMDASNTVNRRMDRGLAFRH